MAKNDIEIKKENRNIKRKYYKILKTQSEYSKLLSVDLMNAFIDYFTQIDIKKMKYTHEIKNKLTIVLKFYKNYNMDFYNTIVKGIKNKKIKFIRNGKTYTSSSECFINLNDNDGDTFKMVHEFAHYVDLNRTPQIIPKNYTCFGEAFSFFIEKQFESYLENLGYDNLIIRRNYNRLYNIKEFAKIMKYQLQYELQYISNNISIRTMDIDIVKYLMDNSCNNIINFSIRYNVGYLLAEYLKYIDYDLNCDNFCNDCLSVDLYEAIDDFKNEIIKTKFIKRKKLE